MFPFLELPALKSEDKPDPNTAVDPSLAEVYYPTPKSYVEEAEKQLELNPPPPKTPFSKVAKQFFSSNFWPCLSRDHRECNPL